MLPDYPQFKRKLNQVLNRRVKEIHKAQLGPFADVRRTFLFEGNRVEFVRADGTKGEIVPGPIEASEQFSRSELKDLSQAKMIERFDAMAVRLADETKRMIFKALDDACKESGNVLDKKAADLKAEDYLMMLEKVQFDFGKDGNPKLPSLFLHPDRMEGAMQELQRLQDDPVLSKRYEEIMNKKREEWHARESNRKLAE
jgi:hypothetical protein